MGKRFKLWLFHEVYKVLLSYGEIMATLAEVVADVQATEKDIAAKVDVVVALVAQLKAGQVDQAQVDALAAAADALKSDAAKIPQA